MALFYPAHAVAPEIAPFDFGEGPLNEGDAAQTQCLAIKGDLPLNITWSFDGDMTAFQTGVVTTSVGQRGSALIIDSVTPRHSGTYTCTVRNQFASVSYSTVLIVNSTQLFAPLPAPFALTSSSRRDPFSNLHDATIHFLKTVTMI